MKAICITLLICLSVSYNTEVICNTINDCHARAAGVVIHDPLPKQEAPTLFLVPLPDAPAPAEDLQPKPRKWSN